MLKGGAKEHNHQNAEQSKVLNTRGADKQTKIELFDTLRQELDASLKFPLQSIHSTWSPSSGGGGGGGGGAGAVLLLRRLCSRDPLKDVSSNEVVEGIPRKSQPFRRRHILDGYSTESVADVSSLGEDGIQGIFKFFKWADELYLKEMRSRELERRFRTVFVRKIELELSRSSSSLDRDDDISLVLEIQELISCSQGFWSIS
ncbi:hypothetical protein Q3G72_033483 [Acer saccharum]|nr:hypothetical protein Q3G72_033483 [Acer saccharum]